NMPTEHLQLALLGLNTLLFAIAFILALLHLRAVATGGVAQSPEGLPHEASMGVPARIAVACATTLGIALFAWRAIAAHSLTLPPPPPPHPPPLPLPTPSPPPRAPPPLLFFFLFSPPCPPHLRSLSFFLLPMIVILLLLGLLLAFIPPDIDRQRIIDAWTLLH